MVDAITQSQLSGYFLGVASKRLTAVEVNPNTSNQHEFNGVASLKQILGTDTRTLPARFVYLGEHDDETVSTSGFVTWYDSRRDVPTRAAEYRLYFPTTPVSERASEGDLLIAGTRTDGSLLIIIAQSGSSAERQLQWLFRLPPEQTNSYSVHEIDENHDVQLGFAHLSILDNIGTEVLIRDESCLERMLRKFNGEFPSTREFSAFARDTFPGDISSENPDRKLSEWMNHELLLFRILEHHLVEEQINTGFADVDSFISFSLSVHNRRKARAGYALENHMEKLLIDHTIHYSRGAETENRVKPDYIFPGIERYKDANFPENRLTMLGVKATCKDRWRQVLSEANRIKDKHLLTLEPGISENQTNEMQANNLQLVVPTSIHESYQPVQMEYLMSVSSFIGLVGERQLSSS